MVFSRISSAILRRNPISSRSISSLSSVISISSSPSNKFNLTTISKFHPQICSNPRITDSFQVRKYSVETPGLTLPKKKRRCAALKKEVAELKVKISEANDAIAIAEESRGSPVSWPNYKDYAERANKALDIVLDKYEEIFSKLGEDEKEEFQMTNGEWIKVFQDTKKKLMNDELMNFRQMLTIWNMTILSATKRACEGNQWHQPRLGSSNFTPTSDFFAQALVDKNKEAAAIQFMKETYMPVIEMMKAIIDVSGMAEKGDIDHVVRLLIKVAIKRPEVLNLN